jgi:hypothetical protein
MRENKVNLNIDWYKRKKEEIEKIEVLIFSEILKCL